MTNNIVAQFSCSVWKSSESARAQELGFSVGDFKEYPVVSGSVFNEEYNETLDSATLVLSQIKLEDRLTLLRSYDYCRVYDKSGQSVFDKIYLVDNFSERENNITDGDRLFGYTINLMSETKLLEKVQCPNLTITHKVNSDGTTTKKTILQYIQQYIKLYSPKAKITLNNSTWNYERIIKLPLKLSDLNTYFKSDINNGRIEFNSVGNAFTTEGNPTSLSIWTFTQSSIGSGMYEFRITNRSGYTLSFPKGYYFGRENNTNIPVIAEEGFTVENNSYHILRTTTGTKSYTMSFVDTREVKVFGMLYKPDFYDKFNVTSADMAFTAPTLRQLLTTLMQQVSCIPTLVNRTLTYLDFKAPGEAFLSYGELAKTINYIDRSLSSDSFANTLVNMSENVLDSGNEVVCERLGFRDKDSSYIKVEENMKLETKFPIYKIDEVKINIPAAMKFTPATAYVNNNSNNQLGTVNWPIAYQVFPENGQVRVVFLFQRPVSESARTVYLRADIGLCSGSNLRQKIALYTNTGIVQGFSSPSGLDGGRYTGTLTVNSSNVGTLQNWAKEASVSSLQNQYTLIIPHNFGNSVNSFWMDMRWYSQSSGAGSSLIVQSFLPLGSKISTDRTVFIDFRDTDFVEMDQDKAYLEVYSNEVEDDQARDIVVTTFADTGGTIRWGTESCTFDSTTHKFRFYGECQRNDVIGGRIRIDYVGQRNDIQTYDFQCVLQANITPLFVENSVRQYLNTNFEYMRGTYIDTIEKLGRFIYGTVGYSIGSKEISGFSEKYTVGRTSWAGWIQEDYTYIENILKWLFDHFSSGIFRDSYKINGGMPFLGTVTLPTEVSSLRPTFWVGNITFDIKYQPLNSFNLSYVKEKEQIDYPLEQYDSGASGLTDFDRLSLNEQEQVDRIGNEVLTISQRTEDISDIRDFSKGPLTYIDARSEENSDIEYIIFKRTFTIKNYFFQASYTGSKDAVLKDYFTSIRTKYRAYQYVDYNQAILRKEKDLVFVRVSEEDYRGGTDKIKMFTQNGFRMTSFVDGIFKHDHENGNPNSIKYSFEQGKGQNNNSKYSGTASYITQLVKNDVSKIANNNSIAFVYEQFDNVGAGPRLNNTVVDTKVGGVSQTWQIWEDSFKTSHVVGFLTKLEAPNTYYDSRLETFYNNFIYKFYANTDGSDTQYTSALKNRMWGANLAEAIAAWPAVVSQYVNSDNFFVKQINTVRLPVFEELDSSNNKKYNFFSYSEGFTVVDNKNSSTTSENSQRSFYQDYAEIINHTVQFRYYAQSENIKWTEWFLRNCSVLDTVDYSVVGFENILVFGYNNDEDFEVMENDSSTSTSGYLGTIEDYSSYIWASYYDLGEEVGTITISWTGALSNYKILKIAFGDNYAINRHDIIAFRRQNNESVTTFKFTLNDTKTDYVLKDKNGILCRAYKTAKNTTTRNVTDLED